MIPQGRGPKFKLDPNFPLDTQDLWGDDYTTDSRSRHFDQMSLSISNVVAELCVICMTSTWSNEEVT